MSFVDSTTEKFLRIAVARWPEDLRDDQSREWAGELYAIRNDDGRGRWRRAWTQLRFGLSLAASPPVNDPNKIPTGWREFMPRLGLTLRRCLMLVGVGLLCIIIVRTLDIASTAWTELSSDPVAIPREYTKATTFLGLLVGVALAAWLGHLLGRSMPLHVRHRRRFGSQVSAALVITCLFAGVVLLSLRNGLEYYRGLAGQLAGFAVLLAVAVLVSALAVRGHRRRAVWWGTGIGLVLLELVSIPLGALGRYEGVTLQEFGPYAGADVALVDFPASLAWFPQSLVFTGVKPGGLAAELELSTISTIAAAMPMLLTLGAFALTYLVRSASTAPVAVPAAVPATPAAPATVSVWRRHLGLTATGLGLVAWAAVLAFSPSPPDPFSGAADLQSVLWSGEARDWSIMLACLGLAWALSGRARVLLPSLAFGLAVLAADIVVYRIQFTGVGAFLLTAGLGGALAVAAWWIPTKLDRNRPETVASRRTVVAVAVLAAYCAPMSLAQFQFVLGSGRAGSIEPSTGWQVTGIPVIMTVLAAGFVVLAVAAARAARNRPLSRAATVAVIGVPVAIMAVLGVTAQLEQPVLGTVLAAALGVPMVVLVTAVMHWDRRERTAADVLRWIAGGLGATVASVLLLYPQYMAALMLGNLLLGLRDLGPELSGFPMFTGILMGAVIYAIAVALVTVRGPHRESAPRSAPDGEPGPVSNGVATA